MGRECAASTLQAISLRALRDASSEAERAFGNGEVYVEKLIDKPRHIEIQIHRRSARKPDPSRANVSVRSSAGIRRSSKSVRRRFVIETPESAERDGSARRPRCGAAGYYNAGTVEFLVDSARGAYYFLEMNTRLQVEHPVTELVTGFDLVQLQLRIAAGEPLDFTQDDIDWTRSGDRVPPRRGRS